MIKIALCLPGGGARGAYQSGALKAINKILGVKKIPFTTISGVSVGSINAAVIAQYAEDFAKGTECLEELWQHIDCQDVFVATNYALGKSVLRNISYSIIKQNKSGYLLDASPLRYFINKHIDFSKIEKNIANKELAMMEVMANCYETHQTVSFLQHYSDAMDEWNYPRHMSKRVMLQTEHVLASSALPLFFAPIDIDGFHYGDGSMGLVAPLRGAIRFEVEKILIIGTRQPAVFIDPTAHKNGDIGFARILGGMLNGLFLDNLDRDIEMVNRMNEIARLLSLWNKYRSPWRPIETLHLRPSADIASMAQAQYQSMPTLLRFLLNLLGAKSHSGDLLSFLLFEKEFTSKLVDLGYKDTLAQADTVLRFFKP